MNAITPAQKKQMQIAIDNWSDSRWRLRNIYFIRDKDGKEVKFTPWPAQEKFLDDLWYRNIVPKARQRGFSTVIQLAALDLCLFNANTAAAIIAQTEGVALQIFADKIVFAYDRLPAWFRARVSKKKNTESEIRWNNNSVMVVSTSTRGLTPQFLHISEYGKIAATAPDRAKEIKRGSLPSVDKSGIIVIESTVESPDDDFSTMCKTALRTADSGRQLSQLDYRLHFASWWDADEYELDPDHVVVSQKDHDYFDRIETLIGRTISPEKRAWYVAKRDNEFSGEDEDMWSQYPSTLEEAFQVSSEGAWLAKQLARARRENRITKVPYMPGYPVFTVWDIGVGDDTAIWFGQDVGAHVHWIDYYQNSAEPYATYVKEINSKEYVYERHYLPHDANHRRPGSEQIRTTKDMLEGLGLRHIEVVPVISDIIVGIDQMREAFPTYLFDETKCKEGLAHAEKYMKSWSTTQGTWQPIPQKNGHQHAADALRQHGQIAHTRRTPSTPGRIKRAHRSGRVV